MVTELAPGILVAVHGATYRVVTVTGPDMSSSRLNILVTRELNQ